MNWRVARKAAAANLAASLFAVVVCLTVSGIAQLLGSPLLSLDSDHWATIAVVMMFAAIPPYFVLLWTLFRSGD